LQKRKTYRGKARDFAYLRAVSPLPNSTNGSTASSQIYAAALACTSRRICTSRTTSPSLNTLIRWIRFGSLLAELCSPASQSPVHLLEEGWLSSSDEARPNFASSSASCRPTSHGTCSESRTWPGTKAFLAPRCLRGLLSSVLPALGEVRRIGQSH
jgi:hypothetical protein